MGARTRVVGLVGYPVAHSYSPVMQQAAIDALGLDLRYLAFAVRPERLGEAIRGAAALAVVGLNVTVPHKEAALGLCRPDGEALATGAVNTLVFDGREDAGAGGAACLPRGLNTDVHGFEMLLDEAGVSGSLAGRRAVVLGAGGAARAVVRVLARRGAEVCVVTRSGRELRFADAGVGEGAGEAGRGGIAATHHSWTDEALAGLLADARVLVDATPRGLDPASTFDVSGLPVDAAVVDLVVRPTTALVEAARRRGLVAATGEAMLLHQGAKAFEAWTGQAAPVAVMRAALAEALRGG